MLFEAAPAKLNLALHIRKRRPDGYHDLETLFAFASEGDLVSVSPAEDLRLAIDGPMADGLSVSDNLVLKAAMLLAHAAGVRPRGHLRLTKNLPVASGIGGGSADAAAALRLLNRFWNTGFGVDELAGMAASLGADVPACVHARAMFGTGKGECLAPVALPELIGAPVLLVNPMVAVPTGPVFAAWDGIDRGPLNQTRLSLDDLRMARNDLQPGAIAFCSEIGDALTALNRCAGLRLARMSGSGATCFAIFETLLMRDKANASLACAYPGWWCLPTTLNHVWKPDLLQVS